MTTRLRTIIPAILIVLLIRSQGPAWEGETPGWMPGGNLMTELRASGINVGFVPGDAFFPIQIDDSSSFGIAIPYFTDGMATWNHEKEMSDDPKENFIEYDYQYPDMVQTHQPVWLGFGRIRIVNMTDEDDEILREFHGCVFLNRKRSVPTKEGPGRGAILKANRRFP